MHVRDLARSTRDTFGHLVERPEGVRGRVRTSLVVLGTVLFIGGLLGFAAFQSQDLFKDTIGSGVTSGQVPRNDGGILFGALMTGTGLGLLLLGIGPRTVKSPTIPFLGFVASITALLAIHFSIFVNAFIISRTRVVSFEASFLFHDSSTLMPIAIFILAGLTFLILYGGAMAAMALVAPDVLTGHFRYPMHPDAHRTRITLVGLVGLGLSFGFVRQFLAYALAADADPSGNFFATNLVLVYYLLTIALLIALGLGAWRTFHLVFGDVRSKRSLAFRRGLRPILNAEGWAWGILLALNLVVLFAKPIMPAADASRVFAMNSRGVSFFVVLLFAGWLFHRRLGTRYIHHLVDHGHADRASDRDHLGILTATAVGTWAFLALMTWGTDWSPVLELALRYGALAIVLPFFALRLNLHDTPDRILEMRGNGAPQILLMSALMSITTGIMLWGLGNSVETTYTPSGGFVAHPDDVLGPYSVGIRALASLFIATPLVLLLGLAARRHHDKTAAGPLLVAAFSVVIGMNLLLTINAANPWDAELGQRDIIVGFRFVELATAFDTAVVVVVWSAISAVGFLAAAALLRRGAEGLEEARVRARKQRADRP